MTNFFGHNLIDQYQRMQRPVPQGPPTSRADAHTGVKELMREAVAHYALARYDAMLAACERALKVDKTYGRAHHIRALALIELGRLEEAVTSLNRALRLAGSAPSYYHGWLLAEKARALCGLGRASEALHAYQEALRLSPSDRTIQAEKEALLTRLIIGQEKRLEES